MIKTAHITMLMTLIETSQAIIFNTTAQSLRETAQFIKSGNYTVNEVKEFDSAKQRFKRVAKKNVRTWCDMCIELDQIFEKQNF